MTDRCGGGGKGCRLQFARRGGARGASAGLCPCQIMCPSCAIFVEVTFPSRCKCPLLAQDAPALPPTFPGPRSWNPMCHAHLGGSPSGAHPVTRTQSTGTARAWGPPDPGCRPGGAQSKSCPQARERGAEGASPRDGGGGWGMEGVSKSGDTSCPPAPRPANRALHQTKLLGAP